MKNAVTAFFLILCLSSFPVAAVDAEMGKQQANVDDKEKVVVESDGISVEKEEGENTPVQEIGAADYWIGCNGSFHAMGQRGHAIYKYGGRGWDTDWTYLDALPVGGTVGWTYKEDGYYFYMFLSKYPGTLGCPSNRFWMGYSHNNVTFYTFQCSQYPSAPL